MHRLAAVRLNAASVFGLALCLLGGIPDLRAQTATANPLTLNDVVAMLQSGVPVDQVSREVTTRRVLDRLDPAGEAKLLAAHANPHLIDLLKGGNYTLSPFDAAAARQRLSAAAAAPANGANSPTMANLLRGGKLITFKNGRVENYDETLLPQKKYIGLYFSAHWCSPCKMFTPKLVAFYQQMAAAHPEFEIVLMSDDYSAADMQKYMTEAKMPWPAVRFERKANERELRKYAGRGIPDLVVVDSTGAVVSDSYKGSEYLGPQKVLRDLAKLLGDNANTVAMTQ